jgi:hypothetical protein
METEFTGDIIYAPEFRYLLFLASNELVCQ